MTPLTGMTASQAAEELRQRADADSTVILDLEMNEALHLASLLEQGARDTGHVARLAAVIDDLRPSCRGPGCWCPGECGVHMDDIGHSKRCLSTRAALDTARGESKDAARAGEKQNG